MSKNSFFTYSTLVFLAVLIFSSIFLGSDLLDFQGSNFSIWFILSMFCFACGYFIDKSFNWHTGTQLVYSITIASAIVSLFVISFFKPYFQISNFTFELFLLIALRNVVLGAMAFFGMAIAEVFTLRAQAVVQSEKIKLIEETIKDARKESDVIIRDAQVKANKIINEAELNAKNTILTQERIEKELREFIQIEKELIKKYEENK
jgi:membrane-bound ClpP family serine protease